MECIIDKKNLQDILKKIQNCISSNSKLLELSSSVFIDVKLNKITFKATDYNMYIEDVIENIEVKKEGKLLIPFVLFKNLVAKYPAEKIHLRKNDNNLELVSGKNLFEIPIVDLDFPESYEVDNEIELEFKENFIKNIFKRFEKIIPDDSDKNSITGLNLNVKNNGTIDFVGTDTFRLYLLNTDDFNIKGEPGSSYIIPKRMVKYIRSVLGEGNESLQLILNRDYIKMIKGNLILKHQLIGDSYPNYEMILPKSLKNEDSIIVKEFKDALGRIKIVSDFLLGDGIVKIKTDDDKNVTIYSSDLKNLEKLNFKFKTQIDKNFDYTQLLDFLNDSINNKVTIKFNDDSRSPVILEDLDVNYMVMPLRNF